MVVGPIGAIGTVPLILAGLLFAVWAASVAFGLHDPLKFRHPGRPALVLLLLVSGASYVALQSGLTGLSTVAERASADRWLVLLICSSAIIFVATETVRSLHSALMLLRALLAGATVCCIIAVIQFYTRTDPVDWIQQAMLGFTYNGGETTFQLRGALARVAGTTFSPIELAVVCSMLLPLSIWRALYDPRGWKWAQWGVTALLLFTVAATVSRSGVLGLSVSLLVFAPFLPKVARTWTIIALPCGLALLFLSVPGLMSTLGNSIAGAGGDLSIQNRTNNYPLVVDMVSQRPLLGRGPGTYMPESALNILDNQYLNTAVSIGLLGLLAIIGYLAVPGIASLIAARNTHSPMLKSLSGALGAAGAVAAVCSLTFDSLSFPIFSLTYPMIAGLSGAVWILVRQEKSLPPPYSGSSLRLPQSTTQFHKSPEGQ